MTTPPGTIRPLERIRVIDCGQMIAGPTIGMYLADFGADVIKVENPGGGDQIRQFGAARDGISLWAKQLGRNKRAISLSLSKPAGQELFLRLISLTQADVVVESFRPGTMERWGLGFDRLRELSPGVSLVRVSGFGQTGPYRDRPGFGTLAEAMSGFAHVTGQADGPPTLPPFALADTVAALHGAIGVLATLYLRDRGPGPGAGQEIDVSLLESMYAMLSNHAIVYDQLGLPGRRMGNQAAGSAPRNTYRTSDERWITIAGSTQPIAERLFRAIGRGDLIDDPRFRTNHARLENAQELDEIIATWVGARTQASCIGALIEAEVAVAPIYDFADLAEDPHLKARHAVSRVEDPELGSIGMPDVAPRLSDTPGYIAHAGRGIGQDNDEIYVRLLGLSPDEVERLRRDGVV